MGFLLKNVLLICLPASCQLGWAFGLGMVLIALTMLSKKTVSSMLLHERLGDKPAPDY